MEVVYISLDTEKSQFENTFKNTPWIAYCDFKGWQTKAAVDYYVNATPTYILIDRERKILLHPKSVAHVEAWMTNRF